jgi:hypothetical protein
MAGKHTALAIACGDEFNEQQLRRVAGPSPLFLFHQTDRLSDGQLAKLCRAPSTWHLQIDGKRDGLGDTRRYA